jgi:hypothetical protein
MIPNFRMLCDDMLCLDMYRGVFFTCRRMTIEALKAVFRSTVVSIDRYDFPKVSPRDSETVFLTERIQNLSIYSRYLNAFLHNTDPNAHGAATFKKLTSLQPACSVATGTVPITT